MKKVDYSSEAIVRRLKQTDQLRIVSLALIEAKRKYDSTLERTSGDRTIERLEKEVNEKS